MESRAWTMSEVEGDWKRGLMCANWRKKRRSRAAAKGMRAPDMMVPLRVTKMLRAMAAATNPAPRGSGNDGERGDGGAFAGGDLRGGQDVLDGGVGGHEEEADDEEAADEGDGQASARGGELRRQPW